MIELHMASAHFPIALLLTQAFFDWVGRFWKKPELRTASYWTHLAGVASATVTIAFGSLGNPFFEDIGFLGNPWRDYGHTMAQKAVQHSWTGICGFLLFASLAVWRVKRKDDFSKSELTIYMLLTVLGMVLVGLTGYLGSHVME